MPPLSPPAPEFGLKAPDFKLKGTDNAFHTLAGVAGPQGTLVMFICNHCPYVKAIAARLAEDTKALMGMGVGVVAIMPNDVAQYPDDSFENMKKFRSQHGFAFPYLIDETQEVAKAYGAVCTPDFFGYNAKGELQFRGRLDESNPSRPATAATRHELLEAMTMIAETGRGPDGQIPSVGCGIKWKAA
jgi:peroxiredoxin